MNPRPLATVILFVGLMFSTVSQSTYAASVNPAMAKAKSQAESMGYSFIASHDEILAGAKREGNSVSSTRLMAKRPTK